MKSLLITVVALLSLSACTVEKRRYNSGWNVQWAHSLPVKKDQANLEEFRSIRFDVFDKVEDSNLLDNNKLNSVKVDDVQVVKLEEEELEMQLHVKEVNVTQKIVTSFCTQGSDLKRMIHEKEQEFKEESIKRDQRKFDIDWELIGTIALLLVLALAVGFVLFGSGTVVTISAILLAIVGLVLIIAAIVCIGWVFWFLFFGWWMN